MLWKDHMDTEGTCHFMFLPSAARGCETQYTGNVHIALEVLRCEQLINNICVKVRKGKLSKAEVVANIRVQPGHTKGRKHWTDSKHIFPSESTIIMNTEANLAKININKAFEAQPDTCRTKDQD